MPAPTPSVWATTGGWSHRIGRGRAGRAARRLLCDHPSGLKLSNGAPHRTNCPPSALLLMREACRRAEQRRPLVGRVPSVRPQTRWGRRQHVRPGRRAVPHAALPFIEGAQPWVRCGGQNMDARAGRTVCRRAVKLRYPRRAWVERCQDGLDRRPLVGAQRPVPIGSKRL
jgi:hypothetical protein